MKKCDTQLAALLGPAGGLTFPLACLKMTTVGWPNKFQHQSAFRSVFRTALITEGDGSSPLQAFARRRQKSVFCHGNKRDHCGIPATILVLTWWKAEIYWVKRAAPCRWPMLLDLPLQIPCPPLSHNERSNSTQETELQVATILLERLSVLIGERNVVEGRRLKGFSLL